MPSSQRDPYLYNTADLPSFTIFNLFIFDLTKQNKMICTVTKENAKSFHSNKT